MSLDRAQWKEIEQRLSRPYGAVSLLVDGYLLDLAVQSHGMRLYITWYVDGSFLGKWLIEDCEQRRRFAYPMVRHSFKAKFRADIRKILGKRRYAKQPQYEATHTTFSWMWRSASALRRHLVKHNASIELAPEKPL